jgi:hypothetical protein
MFLWKPKTCLKGTEAWDFWPLIFSPWIDQIPCQKCAENCGVEALKLGTWSCGFQKKLRLRNCGVAVAEQHFFKSYGIAIAELLSSSCGIAIADSKKSCACPPLSISPPVIRPADTLGPIGACRTNWGYVPPKTLHKKTVHKQELSGYSNLFIWFGGPLEKSFQGPVIC